MDSISGFERNRHCRNDKSSRYSVPAEAAKVYEQGLLSNPLVAKDLPREIHETQLISFTGSESPSLPVNWRLAEAVSSLKALEAALIGVLVKRRYGVELEPRSVIIDTDHATLFLFSTVLWTIDPDGENISADNLRQANPKLFKYFPSCDKYRMNATLHRNLATNIYKCADGRYFQAHGSLNPTPTLENIGLPAERESDAATYEEGISLFEDACGDLKSADIQERTDTTGQAGTICYSVDEYVGSEHGQANAHVGLWEIRERANDTQGPAWWDDQGKGTSRPLAGLKVVDLTRIIAGPCITRSLAELGASVMRCTASHLPDVAALHVDLNWGKWNCNLDLRHLQDREKLTALILEADVVVQGYRPGTLDKFGFGQVDIINLCANRARGIIAVRENCYGWYGPWRDRIGWQQIADANTGLSFSFGHAMGLDEPVTPIFPHSDYCTGVAGSCTVIIALLRRAETGGSYSIDLALNYYSTWLIKSVGTYPPDVWDKLWSECGRPIHRSWVNNGATVPATLRNLRSGPGGDRLFQKDFFQDRSAPGPLGDGKIRGVKGVADWAGVVELGFNVGTRGNGVDAPRWPENLDIENVE